MFLRYVVKVHKREVLRLYFIVKRIEVRTRLAVFTNRQCERDNGRLSVNSLAVQVRVCVHYTGHTSATRGNLYSPWTTVIMYFLLSYELLDF